MSIDIVICTHNRLSLLRTAIQSLNIATRPNSVRVSVVIVASACSDGTAAWLHSYQQKTVQEGLLPLRWVEEISPGKSRALNKALELIESQGIAFVDDDHRVDPLYLVGIHEAMTVFPEASLFCGRIRPDWNGREPNWAHDEGPYRIYPLPVPRFDRGDTPHEIRLGVAVPGGGNLFVRREVFARVGGFSTELGPQGHNLGGGEDSDFVLRALRAGEQLYYIPNVIQYHYVDPARFRLGYLLRKSYQRSHAVSMVREGASIRIPRHMWRKLFEYSIKFIYSVSIQRKRFYLVRLAATLGEMQGLRRSADL